MTKSFENYLKQELNEKDVPRAENYMQDLLNGLKLVRTYPQGVTIFGSARLPEDNEYCVKARKLGNLLAENGHTVITGGGPSIMEAASRGAYELGGRVIGLNIRLRHEQHPNPYLTDCLTFEYFFARKVMLAMSAKVFVFFPGGFGTLDEFSEIILLMQEGKMPKMPVFLIGSKFWKNGKKMLTTMEKNGLIHKKDAQIFQITDRLEDVVEAANRIGHPKVSENYFDGFNKHDQDKLI